MDTVDWDVHQWVTLWALAVGALALAVVLPIVTWRRLARPELLRERVLLSARGAVMTVVVISAVVAAVMTMLYIFFATLVPAAWAMVLMLASWFLSVVMYAVRYIGVRRQMEREIIREQAAAAESGQGPDLTSGGTTVTDDRGRDTGR